MQAGLDEMAEDASANSALLEKAKAVFDSLDTDGMGDSRAKTLTQANSQTLIFLSSQIGFLFASRHIEQERAWRRSCRQ